jgi:hypothetical protein
MSDGIQPHHVTDEENEAERRDLPKVKEVVPLGVSRAEPGREYFQAPSVSASHSEASLDQASVSQPLCKARHLAHSSSIVVLSPDLCWSTSYRQQHVTSQGEL